MNLVGWARRSTLIPAVILWRVIVSAPESHHSSVALISVDHLYVYCGSNSIGELKWMTMILLKSVLARCSRKASWISISRSVSMELSEVRKEWRVIVGA